MNIIIVVILFSLTIACSEDNASSNLDFSPSKELSKSAESEYALTVYPVLKKNCGVCHGSNQAPTFVAENAGASLNTIVNYQLIDLNLPHDSRLIQKIISGHNNFPLSIANEIESAIDDWLASSNLGEVIPPAETSPPTDTEGSSKTESVNAFEQTLYPLLQTSCSSCHGSFQNPLFALSDTTGSHNILLDFGLVDLSNPKNSRLVSKILSGHQNFAGSLATSFEEAITSWKNMLGDVTIEPPKPLTASFSAIHQRILIPKCVGCHSPTGIRPKEDYSSYETTIRTGKISAGNPQDSEMYKECLDGTMPENADRLTNEELEVIRDWIAMGAQNN